MQYGEDAVKEGMGGGGGPPGGMSDIFDILSGGGGRGGGRQRERRGENVVHRLKVSLEEVYNGGTRSGLACKSISKLPGMSSSRKRICSIRASLLSRELLLCSYHVAALLAMLRCVDCPSVLRYLEGTALHSNSRCPSERRKNSALLAEMKSF